MHGSQVVHPEGTYYAGQMVPRTSMAHDVERAVSNECTRAWTTIARRTGADNAERADMWAVSDADRYAEGLERVRALTARAELRRQILEVEDESARRELMGEYPELFDDGAARGKAQKERDAERPDAMAAWLAAHPDVRKES